MVMRHYVPFLYVKKLICTCDVACAMMFDDYGDKRLYRDMLQLLLSSSCQALQTTIRSPFDGFRVNEVGVAHPRPVGGAAAGSI